MLIKKQLLNKSDINKLKLSRKETEIITKQDSFVIKALSGVLDKMDDPLGKKRGSIK